MERIISEERQKKRTGSATRLEEALRKVRRREEISFISDEELEDLLIEIRPERALDSLILNNKIQRACEQIIEEQDRTELLYSYGVYPNHRMLLYGASGNGKTSLAEAIAKELSLPLFSVRYESLIDSLLGKTSKGIGDIFNFAKKRNGAHYI